MISRLSVCIFLLLQSLAIWAQEQPLATGIELYKQEQYAAAIQSLEGAIHPDRLIHPLETARAYWYLMQANQQLGDRPVSQNGTQPLLEAFYYYGRFTRHPYHTDIVRPEVLQTATASLTASLIQQGETLIEHRQYAAARNHLTTARMLSPEQAQIPFLFGQLSLGEGDTTRAIAYFRKVVSDTSLSMQNPTASYFQLSEIYAAQSQLDSALFWVQKGQQSAPAEILFFQQELRLYQTQPDPWNHIQTRFESAIARFPQEQSFKVVYAGMLYERDQQAKALTYYEQVYAADSQHYFANVALGAHYIAEAAAYQQRRRWEINDPEATHLIPQLVGMLDKAYPHILTLHQQAPHEVKWIEQMITITTFLGFTEEQAIFEEKLKALGGNN